MINQLSGSGNVDSCFPKPQKPSIHPSHKKIQKSFHCQPTLDALNDLVTEVSKPEPPLKRQKLEDNPNAEIDGSSGSLRKPLGEYNAKLPVQQRSEIATTNGVRLPIKPVEEAPSSNARTIQRTLPIFPDRPCLERRGIRKECASPTLEAIAKKNVQIKPYVPESPSSAPKYQKSGS